MSNIEIFSTLGPASFNPSVISRLDELGISLFRINLSHTNLDDLPSTINLIRNSSKVPICLDTEGAQVRTGSVLEKQLYLSEGLVMQLSRDPVAGDSKCFNLYPYYVFDQLREGDILTIGFDSLTQQVIHVGENSCELRVLTAGILSSNKGVRVDRSIRLDFLTDKDHKALEIALDHGVNTFALSFSNSKNDVDKLRLIIGNDNTVISKIESMEAINNLDELCAVSDMLLIDRGDLSGDVSLEKLPIYQKRIISTAKHFGKRIFVATNLLESMVENSLPSRAEVSDVYHILSDGADGLVLAAETAIGKYPVHCAAMIKNIIKHYNMYNSKAKTLEIAELHSTEVETLVQPHGGALVNGLVTTESDYYQKNLKKIEVDSEAIMDAEQIAIGTFSPIDGFMDKEAVDSVLNEYRLPNGLVWTMPIFLQIPAALKKKIDSDDHVALVLENTGEVFAVIDIDEIFEMDITKMSKLMFNTADSSHPGVKRLFSKGNLFLGGKVRLLKRLSSNYKYLELTPSQMRMVFQRKGWHRIVGFHTRNVPHRVHEFIQLQSFEEYNCDGMLIHPIIGRKKTGDFSSRIILESYKIVMDKYYPKNRSFISAFQSYPRYCGPREAIFTALCRKNFGCSHFIIGRDHTGVGKYYKRDEISILLDQIGDIGMEMILHGEMEYCNSTKQYVVRDKSITKNRESISGTFARDMLKKGVSPPNWFMRTEVSDFILHSLRENQHVFVED